MIPEDHTMDLAALFKADDAERRWQAERENADARLELTRIRKRAALLASQHEPVAHLNIDREQLRALLRFLGHGDEKRLARELAPPEPETKT